MADKHCACVRIDDTDWHGRTHDFSERVFYIKQVKYFFQAPMDVDERMAEAADVIDKKGYMVEEPTMVLEQPGRFKGAIMVAVYPPGEPDPHVQSLPHKTMMSTVYERKEANIQPGIKAFKRSLEKTGKTVKAIYLWHVTCPNCGEDKGYKTVIFAAV